MLVKVIFTRVKQSKSNRINKQIRENKLYLIEYQYDNNTNTKGVVVLNLLGIIIHNTINLDNRLICIYSNVKILVQRVDYKGIKASSFVIEEL